MSPSGYLFLFTCFFFFFLSPYKRDALPQLLKSWQMTVLSHSSPPGMVVIGQSGSANSRILLGAPTYYSWLVWGHKDLVLLVQCSTVGGEPFCLHGFQQCLMGSIVPKRMEESWFSLTSPPWTRGFSLDQQDFVVLTEVHLLHLSALASQASFFHRGACQEHFFKPP